MVFVARRARVFHHTRELHGWIRQTVSDHERVQVDLDAIRHLRLQRLVLAVDLCANVRRIVTAVRLGCDRERKVSVFGETRKEKLQERIHVLRRIL